MGHFRPRKQLSEEETLGFSSAQEVIKYSYDSVALQEESLLLRQIISLETSWNTDKYLWQGLSQMTTN